MKEETGRPWFISAVDRVEELRGVALLEVCAAAAADEQRVAREHTPEGRVVHEQTLSTQDPVPVEAPVSIELGSAPLDGDSMKQLTAGSLVTLDRQVHDPVDVLVAGRLIARGELIVIEDELAVRIVELI